MQTITWVTSEFSRVTNKTVFLLFPWIVKFSCLELKEMYLVDMKCDPNAILQTKHLSISYFHPCSQKWLWILVEILQVASNLGHKIKF